MKKPFLYPSFFLLLSSNMNIQSLIKEYWLKRHIPSLPDVIIRKPWWRGFSYRKNNQVVWQHIKKRCESLWVAPSWTEVRYAIDKNSHVQALADDASWKRQYIYHKKRSIIREQAKFEKLLDAKNQLTIIRWWYTDVLENHKQYDSIVWQEALILYLLDSTWKRIGSVTNDSSDWIVSLNSDHLTKTQQWLLFTYIWKAWKTQTITIIDNQLLHLIQELVDLETKWYIWWDSDTVLSAVTIRDRMQDIWSSRTPKDLRMRKWASEFFNWWTQGESYFEALDHVADDLWNTRTISKKYYVPLLLQEAWHDGRLSSCYKQVCRTRSTQHLSQNEHRLRKILQILYTT